MRDTMVLLVGILSAWTEDTCSSAQLGLLLIEQRLVLAKQRTKIEIGYSHYYDVLDTELLHSLQSVVIKLRTPEQVIATF